MPCTPGNSSTRSLSLRLLLVKVTLYGSGSNATEIHVGSPRYITEVVPLGATHADPLLRRLLFAEEGAEEFDSHEEPSALSVSFFVKIIKAPQLRGQEFHRNS